MYKVGDEVLVRVKLVEYSPIDLMYLCELKDGSKYIRFLSPAECIADKTYADGLNDAWELAKQIYHAPCEGGLEQKEIEEIFDCKFTSVTHEYTAEEALAKIEAYEKENEIKVGDVVNIFHNGSNGVVVKILESGGLNIVLENGIFYADCSRGDCTKTGKHIEIESLLMQIGE